MGILKKPVVEITFDGQIIRYHESVKECADYNGIVSGPISAVLKGYYFQHKGKRWRYATPAETLQYENVVRKIKEADRQQEEAQKQAVQALQLPTSEEVITSHDTPSPPLSNFQRMLNRKK